MQGEWRPTPEEIEDHLVLLCFGRGEPGEEPLDLTIHRAYLDFCRTLHGIGGDSKHAYRQLRRALVHLQKSPPSERPQEDFDAWHLRTCEGLIAAYADHGYGSFHVGQAQKWINMVLKYILILGERRVPGFGHLIPSLHVPLDRIIIEKLSNHSCPPLSKSWSRLDDYEEYLAFQKWIRRTFRGDTHPSKWSFCFGQAGA